ncbi:hypothetical protein [Marilutibacter alkalisoli]|uniref:Uncharacterized protein n=1 Tax=Marilutibacter alkalisoli TaxID=2591633 RepID=A0A514BN65_9GAMM|nr:hypothetical protein [Lysobacter alkalisoli]QDH68812.1 hypothetical protein FKV23_00810 [Lysobacter alkalisoli]
MTQPHSHLEIALASIRVFADDGQLDVAELNGLLDLALRDHVIDPDERRVLGNILVQAEKGPVAPEVARRIGEVRRRHDIPA